MRRVLVLLAIIACKDREPDRIAPAQVAKLQPPAARRVDPAAAARERNTALGTAPYDYKATDKPCPVEIPRQLSSPDVTAIDVKDIETALPTRGDASAGYETILVAEVQGNQTTIGRIYVWDRAAKKMLCGTAYNVTSSVVAATRAQNALETAKPLALVETASVKPNIPDHMPARTGKRVLKAAAGDSHFCALVEDGTVRCFGQNDVGQCGDLKGGDFVPRPFKVPGITDAIDIAAGGKHTCVRRKSGAITCWGATHTPHCATERGPFALPASLVDVAWLGIAFDHACALHTDGTASCWGKNEYGQVGDGTQAQYPKPVPTRPLPGEPTRVKPLAHVKQLAVGTHRSAAILDDGALATWGYGPIGDGRDCSGPPCDGLVPTVIPLE